MKKRKQRQPATRSYRFTMPGDIQRVTLQAWATGSIAALEDYPMVIPTLQKLTAVAQMTLTAIESVSTRPLTNDMKTFATVFTEAFVLAYMRRVEEYQASPAAFHRDKEALKQCGARTLARAFIENAG